MSFPEGPIRRFLRKKGSRFQEDSNLDWAGPWPAKVPEELQGTKDYIVSPTRKIKVRSRMGEPYEVVIIQSEEHGGRHSVVYYKGSIIQRTEDRYGTF